MVTKLNLPKLDFTKPEAELRAEISQRVFGTYLSFKVLEALQENLNYHAGMVFVLVEDALPEATPLDDLLKSTVCRAIACAKLIHDQKLELPELSSQATALHEIEAVPELRVALAAAVDDMDKLVPVGVRLAKTDAVKVGFFGLVVAMLNALEAIDDIALQDVLTAADIKHMQEALTGDKAVAALMRTGHKFLEAREKHEDTEGKKAAEVPHPTGRGLDTAGRAKEDLT